jgi:AraC-like DNA-binding protein
VQTLTVLPVNILQFVFAVQMIFAVFILLPNKNNKSLVYLLTAVITLMLINLLEELKVTYDLHLVSPSFSLLFGPLFYFFVYQLTLNQLYPKNKLVLHLIPALVSLAITDFVQVVLAIGTLSQVIYFILGLKLVRLYQTAIFNHRSDAMSLQLTWLRNVLTAMIVITLIDLTRLNLQPILDVTLASYWYFFMQVAFYLLTSYLVICAVKQPELFTGLHQLIEQAKLRQQERTQSEAIFTEIDQVIIEEKLYRQPRLSLQDLQQRFGLTTKDISLAINSGSELNFCDYINQHRLNEVKAKLNNNSKANLLQLAVDSGFNSKSSFNKSFKKLLKVTPTQYINSLKS